MFDEYCQSNRAKNPVSFLLGHPVFDINCISLLWKAFIEFSHIFCGSKKTRCMFFELRDTHSKVADQNLTFLAIYDWKKLFAKKELANSPLFPFLLFAIKCLSSYEILSKQCRRICGILLNMAPNFFFHPPKCWIKSMNCHL